MKKDVTKILWGTFLVVMGLLWICTSTGLIESRTFSGLLFASILVLIGVSIMLKNANQEKADGDSTAGNTGYSSKENESGSFSKEDSYEGDFRQSGYEDGFSQTNYEYDAGQSNKEDSFSHNGYEKDFSQDSYKNESSYNSYIYGKGKDNNFKQDEEFRQTINKVAGKEHYSSILSSQNVIFTEEFTGAELMVLAGGIELDLRNAVITRDIVIDVSCIMGGITIFLPSNVMVSVSCTPIMGGVESKIDGSYNKKDSNVTVYIRGTCFMGGIEIR
jgi:hypothetical protein